MSEKPWLWGATPLEPREKAILVSLLLIAAEHSESGNNWQETPYSKDLRLIVEKLEDLNLG